MMDGTNVGASDLKHVDIGDAQPGTASTVSGPAMLAVTSADLQTAIKSASTAYVSARENAANAAATVYYVWYHACSEHATAENAAWYEGAFNEREREIEAHNNAIKREEDAEEEATKAKVRALREEKRGINDQDRRSEKDDAIKAIEEDGARRLRDLKNKRKVKAEARCDAAPFTEITKFVLELNGKKQSSQVNRFATVVKWINAEFKRAESPVIAKIAERILDEGGFDEVYGVQQARDGKKPQADTGPTEPAGTKKDSTTKASEAVMRHFSKVVSTAPGLGTLPLNQHHTLGSVVALIGRVGADGITVISDIGMPLEEALHLCMERQDRRLLPGDAASEFVARALSAGEVVDEFKRVGKDSKCTPELSMVADDSSRRLVISGLNAAVSVVVHAEPKQQAKALLPKLGLYRLTEGELEKLKASLADGVARKMMTLRANEQEQRVGERQLTSSLAWESTMPFETDDDQAANKGHAWLEMSPAVSRPLDVDGFSPRGSVTLAYDELLKLKNGTIGNWKAKKTDDKETVRATVTIGSSEIAISTMNGVDRVTCAGSLRTKVELTFRSRMLSKVISKVSELATGPVELAPDDRGALRIAFEDANGRYSVYVPACDGAGGLEGARFHEMRVPEANGE
jgi:hypothetical protein